MAFKGQFGDAGLIEFAFAHFDKLGVLLKCGDRGCGIGSGADLERQLVGNSGVNIKKRCDGVVLVFQVACNVAAHGTQSHESVFLFFINAVWCRCLQRPAKLVRNHDEAVVNNGATDSRLNSRVGGRRL